MPKLPTVPAPRVDQKVFRALLHRNFGYRTVTTAVGEKRIEDAIAESLPQIGVGDSEVFEVIIRPVKE